MGIEDEYLWKSQGVRAALFVGRVDLLLLENVHILESNGYGLLTWNFGDSTLSRCKFESNYWRKGVNQSVCDNPFSHNDSECGAKPGGNVLFARLFSPSISQHVDISVLHSEFMHGIGTSFIPSKFSNNCAYAGGLGVFLINMPCHISLHNCTLWNNTAPSGGNMFLYSNARLALNINTSSFCQDIASVIDGGGGGIYINTRGVYAKAEIHISHSSFLSNYGNIGGGMFLEANKLWEEVKHVMQLNTTIEECRFHGNSGGYGGGMSIKAVHIQFSVLINPESLILIFKSVFQNNTVNWTGSALYIVGEPNVRLSLLGTVQVNIVKCSFIWNTVANFPQHNAEPKDFTAVSNDHNVSSVTEATLFLLIKGKLGGRATVKDTLFIENNCTGIYIGTDTLWGYSEVSFHGNVRFVNNTGATAGGVHIDMGITVTFSGDVLFLLNTGHSGGAVYVNESAVNFKGNMIFTENKADCGGAIAFIHNSQNSFLHLDFNSTIKIANNTAFRYGGGIYVAGSECSSKITCFFQTDLHNSEINFTPSAGIVMENNTAKIAGDFIYGGYLETCYLKIKSQNGYDFRLQQITAATLWSTVRAHSHSQSEVAAKPVRVNFCDVHSVGNSCSFVKHVSVFRGQLFHVHAMAVGQFCYATPAMVFSKVAPQYVGELGVRQSAQELGNTCGALTYSVRTPDDFIQILLCLSLECDSNILNQPAILSVSFLPCPFGFELSGHPPKCDCAEHLRKPGVQCHIDNETIHRSPAVWIGNFSNDVVVHNNCPFDYCRPESNDINLFNQDNQCQFNRTGILCGACKPGLGLALGGSKCLQCSNNLLLLLLLFAFAGMVLIILLLKCNLTVSTGTINGLIFYANVIRINRAIFFPPNQSPVMQVLSVYIAWLNLDLGIETCFSENMNAYTLTWLQFIFPLYIWLLVILLIYVSWYSVTVSRLTGSNTVSVLATLFLLAYAKLLQTIIAAVSFTTLTDKQGITSAVWLLDGNLAYLSGPHIALFIASITALFLYVVPFTLLVLSAPYLQARSNLCLLRWVNRFKPLLDAYQGPYKDKFRYWTGLILLVRIILFSMFAGNALGDPRLNLFIIAITMFVLLAFWLIIGGSVYKLFILNVLDCFFVLDAGIFAVATLFLEGSHVNQQAVLTYIMVGSTFGVFCSIVVYQFYQQLKKVSTCKRHCILCKQFFLRCDCTAHQLSISLADIDNTSTVCQHRPPTVSVVDLNQLREPLLTD